MRTKSLNEHSKKSLPGESGSAKCTHSPDPGTVNSDPGGAYFMDIKINKKSEKHYLYFIRDFETGEIIYIGITSDIERRKLAHMGNGQNIKHTIACYEAILRHMGKKIKFEMIKEFIDYDTAHSMEIKLIDKLKPKFNFCHNKDHKIIRHATS